MIRVPPGSRDAQERRLAREIERQRIAAEIERLTGEKPKPKQGLFSKAKSLARAIASAPASDEVFATRSATCDKCPAMKVIKGKRYCSDCDCPQWWLAELDRKLRMSGVKCPRGHF